MNESMQDSDPPDIQAELARERNRGAAERSLLSFIRNSVTLISAGFGIDQIAEALTPTVPHVKVWVYVLNLALIGLGVMNLLFAAQDYRGEMQRLNQSEYTFTPRWSVGEVTGIVLAVSGFLVFLRLGYGILSRTLLS